MDFDLGVFDEDQDGLCPRNKVLPMCPEWTEENTEPVRGVEPPTNCLQGSRSTAELHRHRREQNGIFGRAARVCPATAPTRSAIYERSVMRGGTPFSANAW